MNKPRRKTQGKPWEKRESRDMKRDDKKKDFDKDRKKSPTNDPGFYTLNQQLVDDAASLPYSIPTGSKFPFLESTPYTVQFGTATNSTISMPGVMALYALPTYGKSEDNTSAINVCAQNMYSYVRHANSGHSNYDSPDLMMYLLAMDSIYSCYQHLCRIYGVCRTYAQQNRYFPRSVVHAMNVDFDDVLNNLANFRYGINSLAVKIGSLCVPNSLSLYARHMQVFSGYYLDAALPQAQIYEFVPYGFWQWNEIGTPGQPGKLVLAKVGKYVARWTVSTLLAFANDLVDRVLATEDFNIMSGDILKAFGEGNLIKVAPISEEYTVIPSYDPAILMQIHNATIMCGVAGDNIVIDDIQNDPNINAILHKVEFTTMHAGLLGRRILDIPVPVTNPTINMEATRLMLSCDEETKDASTNLWTTKMGSWGSEIIVEADIYTYFFSAGGAWQLETKGLSYKNDMHTTVANIGKLMYVLSKFSSHPFCLLGTWSNAGVPTYYGLVGDTIHFTTVDGEEIKKMHETALLSEFKVPQMGAFAG